MAGPQASVRIGGQVVRVDDDGRVEAADGRVATSIEISLSGTPGIDAHCIVPGFCAHRYAEAIAKLLGGEVLTKPPAAPAGQAPAGAVY